MGGAAVVSLTWMFLLISLSEEMLAPGPEEVPAALSCHWVEVDRGDTDWSGSAEDEMAWLLTLLTWCLLESSFCSQSYLDALNIDVAAAPDDSGPCEEWSRAWCD